MAKRGRPAGTDSTETRRRIVDVARTEFAARGYATSAITAIAASADLAPSAIYHYFGGKAELYEAVFEDTSGAIWADLGASVVGRQSLIAALEQLVHDSRQLTDTRPHFNDFLALVPMEARLHPEFSHLLDRRSKYQDDTFRALAELGISTGELEGFTEVEATEIIRAVVMGWFFERHFRGSEMPGSGEAILHLFRTIAQR